MPSISEEKLKHHNSFMRAMHNERSQWESLWKECSQNYLPQRYRSLMTSKEYFANRARRQYIINNTGTLAARTLAAGMMNGITSPSRPWFKLRVPGLELEQHRPLAAWLEIVERILLRIMAESNFYNSMAILYLDMAVFGTGVSLIYPDFKSVIRCHNPPLGEYFLGSDERGVVDIFARKFNMKIHQYIRRWPDRRYWSDRVKNAVEQSGQRLNDDVEISHFIGPNIDNMVGKQFPYYEMYWESRRTESAGTLLEKRGYKELMGIFARWEVSGAEPYGVSPGMDALGDNIELQHLHRNKATLLEKSHQPPMLVDSALRNDPLSLQPKGVTFVAGLGNNKGAMPLFLADPKFGELNMDQVSIERRIRDAFFNFLFTGITNLDKVKSATEIDARESEKLILLGGVLERFESEALDPAIQRIYSLAERAELIPPPPPQYEDMDLEIQYVSLLSIAQRATGTAPAERALAVMGNLAAVYPSVLDIPDIDRLITNYFLDIGVRQSEIRSPEEVMGIRQQREQVAASQQAVEAGGTLAGAAKNLSETDVGGGANLLQTLMQSS